MCSMGLVHSRLARVVYSQADKQHGALGGKMRLHAQRSLNHHYLVYHMPAKQQQQKEQEQPQPQHLQQVSTGGGGAHSRQHCAVPELQACDLN